MALTTDSTLPLWSFSVCVYTRARKCDAVTARESETVTLKICRDKQTEFADKWREQVTAQRDYHKGRARGGRRHKRRSWLVPIHQPSIFPLTHGTQMKTDFKGEDEKHSLLKAKCFTRGPCANTVVLSEKWTTVKLANRCASHTHNA